MGAGTLAVAERLRELRRLDEHADEPGFAPGRVLPVALDDDAPVGQACSTEHREPGVLVGEHGHRARARANGHLVAEEIELPCATPNMPSNGVELLARAAAVPVRTSPPSGNVGIVTSGAARTRKSSESADEEERVSF